MQQAAMSVVLSWGLGAMTVVCIGMVGLVHLSRAVLGRRQ